MAARAGTAAHAPAGAAFVGGGAAVVHRRQHHGRCRGGADHRAERSGRVRSGAPHGESRSRRSVGVFSNRYLLWAIAGELAIAAVFVFVPPCQALLGTAVPPARDMLLLIAFPFIVWGADELRKWVIRTRSSRRAAGRRTSTRRLTFGRPATNTDRGKHRPTPGLTPMAACSSSRRAAGCVAISDIAGRRCYSLESGGERARPFWSFARRMGARRSAAATRAADQSPVRRRQGSAGGPR